MSEAAVIDSPAEPSVTAVALRRSRLLEAAGFRHAFFTRRGGASKGAYASLNFSAGVGDDPGDVEENLRRAADVLGVTPEHVLFLSQVHGAEVRRVTASDVRSALVEVRGDAVVGASPVVACGVRVADCAPVLVGDRGTGAVAAIHAGWRGTVAGVVASAVAELRDLIGGAGDLVAAIGPHISQKAFEVSDDVALQLAAASPDPHVVDRSTGPKPRVDLRRILRAQLVAVGLTPEAIDDVPGCTVLDPDLFSYRRDGKRSGRHLAAIVPRG